MQIRIYYEDTDAGGIVYHANYLKYCERARSEYFFKKGLTPIIDGAHFVVRKMDCDFINSAKFADIIEVSTSLVQMKKSSFTLFQEIKKDDKVLFTATALLVLVKDGKVKRIDSKIEELLNSLFN
ncbi:MAG: YbgC/FadM family acyl-CoA thioesterase [Campylobacterota bacterium]|nr:YbgC/FadM family acyl-CoA thioesterase [Campylobacterota bacterium]